MGALLVYMLKSAVCLILFYLFYMLLLSKETFHRFNRFVLLGVMLLSFVIPLIEVNIKTPSEVHEAIQTIDEFFVPYEDTSLPTTETTLVPIHQQEGMNGVQILLAVYLIGSFTFAVYSLWSLIQLVLLLKSCRRKRLEDYLPDGKGISLWLHDKKCSPFGWMNCIVIREKDLKENGREILIHERAHIRMHHSLDLLVAELCIFFQWFNPAAWLLKKELQTVHEYEADGAVINEGINAKQYQLLLIKRTVGAKLYSMANSLNQNQLKKRFSMMQKEKSKGWARWKCIYVLPLTAVAIGGFARPEVSAKANEFSAITAKDFSWRGVQKEIETNMAIHAMQTQGTSYSVDGVKVNKQDLYAIGTKDIAAIDVTHSVEDGELEMAVTTRSNVGKTLTPVTEVPVDDKPAVVEAPLPNDVIFHHLDRPISYTTQEEKDNLVGKSIYTETDQAPQFPGGEAAYQQFYKENAHFASVMNDYELDYPYVLLEFIVWKDGSISNVSVHQAFRKSWANEAVRFLKSMPKWIPARMDGTPVNARIYYPILVMPQDDFRLLMIERDYRHNVKPRRQLKEITKNQ